MNPTVKQKWLAALRSGEYEQGKGKLEREGKFCCLGVLCKLAVDEGVVMRTPEGYYGNPNSYLQDSVLPEEVMDWAMLDDNNPDVFDEEVGNAALAALNDEEGWTFEEIASVIEAQL